MQRVQINLGMDSPSHFLRKHSSSFKRTPVDGDSDSNEGECRGIMCTCLLFGSIVAIARDSLSNFHFVRMHLNLPHPRKFLKDQEFCWQSCNCCHNSLLTTFVKPFSFLLPATLLSAHWLVRGDGSSTQFVRVCFSATGGATTGCEPNVWSDFCGHSCQVLCGTASDHAHSHFLNLLIRNHLSCSWSECLFGHFWQVACAFAVTACSSQFSTLPVPDVF